MAILKLIVDGQNLKIESEISRIVENSINYLDYEIVSYDKNWDTLAKEVIVTYSGVSQKLVSNIIPSSVIQPPGFSLSVIGYLIDGENKKTKQITTSPLMLQVWNSGDVNAEEEEVEELNDATVVEQINSKLTSIETTVNNNKTETDTKISSIEENIDTIENNIKVIEENIGTIEESVINKVTSIDENSTDTQYPTAKAVYDFGMRIYETISGDLDAVSALVGGIE